MKQMRIFTYLRLIVFVAVLLAMSLHPTSVKACSCEAGISIPHHVSIHDAVFTGKVVRIVDNYYPIWSTLDNILQKITGRPYFFYEDGRYWGYSVFLNVIDSWKGVMKTIVEVDTGYGMGDCGYTFEKDKEYLIYASHAYGIPANYWVTGTCGRTAEVSNATEDFQYLEEFPIIPLKSTFPLLVTEKDSIIFGFPSLIVIGIVIFAKRRRKTEQQHSKVDKSA